MKNEKIDYRATAMRLDEMQGTLAEWWYELDSIQTTGYVVAQVRKPASDAQHALADAVRALSKAQEECIRMQALIDDCEKYVEEHLRKEEDNEEGD